MSLSTLHKTHQANSQSIASVRARIGSGVTLSCEGVTVWLFNRCERNVFVSSLYLNTDRQCGDSWEVKKLSPGHSMVIYDYSVIERQRRQWPGGIAGSAMIDGPSDPHSIHMSFIKGWSGSYSRQTVLSCECWLEILINKWRFGNT